MFTWGLQVVSTAHVRRKLPDAETKPPLVWHGSVHAPMVPSELLLNI